MALAGLASGNIGQCIEGQMHIQVSSRGIQQCAKLTFRRRQSGIGHVVDEPDPKAIRI
jgi:hypothetical protein